MLKNKKILFIVEKPSQAEIIKSLKIYNSLLSNNEINFHYAHCTVPYYSYKYQNNLKYKELPFIGDLKYKLDLSQYNKFLKEYPDREETPYFLSKNNLNKEFFLNYDTIIIATDYDNSGFYGAYLELEQVLGENFNTLFQNMYVINTNNMTEIWLTNELNTCFNNIEFKNQRINEFYKMVNQGKIKKYFEYNFQINCNIFIKKVYKHLFFKDFKDNQEFEETYNNYGFTKYMLLAMFSFYYNLKERELENFKIHDLHVYLFRYVGTGKYKHNQGIGSPASQAKIIENLKNLKIINQDNSTYFFDEKVEDLIKLLNKKIYDPDLPFRIEEWQYLEFEEAKEKINRYVKDIFIKQKIKNSFLKK